MMYKGLVKKSYNKELIQFLLNQWWIMFIEKISLKSEDEAIFAIEFLPGQYDQRADSCEQCFAILTGNT